MSRLLLVRHGNTKSNSAERFWGNTDIELSDIGIRQAEQLRDRLATEKIDAIYTSKLQRASVTAGIIASRHQTTATTCPELNETNFGKLEGLTFSEISQLYPELVKIWPVRNLDFRFPGGESLGELNSRVTRFLSRLEKYPPEETILIVAHSGVLRLLLCHLLDIDPGHWRQFRTDLASLSILETYSQITILNSLNDTSHLLPE